MFLLCATASDVFFRVAARIAGAAPGHPDALFSPHTAATSGAGIQQRSTGDWSTKSTNAFVYTLNMGLSQSATVEFVLQSSSGSSIGGITLQSAFYGAQQRKSVDVTERVRALMQNANDADMSFIVTNEAMGGDPVPYVKKKLTVKYTVTGVLALRTLVAEEGDLFKFDLVARSSGSDGVVGIAGVGALAVVPPLKISGADIEFMRLDAPQQQQQQ